MLGTLEAQARSRNGALRVGRAENSGSGSAGLILTRILRDGQIDLAGGAPRITSRPGEKAFLLDCARTGRPRPIRWAADGAGAVFPVAILKSSGSSPISSPVVVYCDHSTNGARHRSVVAGRIGLTGLEMRIADALVCMGDLRQAARRAGVGYETARKVAKSAMAKVGVGRQAQLIGRWVPLYTFGIVLEGSQDDRVMEHFDLTRRQTRIADLSASGLCRDEVAWRLGVSIHVVKSELKVVFDACGVHTQTALAALAAELRVLDAVVRAHQERGPNLLAA